MPEILQPPAQGFGHRTWRTRETHRVILPVPCEIIQHAVPMLFCRHHADSTATEVVVGKDRGSPLRRSFVLGCDVAPWHANLTTMTWLFVDEWASGGGTSHLAPKHRGA